MKAALLHAVGQPLVLADVPEPELDGDEVLVATRTCGICRTDLHLQDGIAYVPPLPHVLGHEPAGVVAAVGENVKQWRPGDRVVPHLFVYDRECRYTRAGQHAQATHLRGILGVTVWGGFATYFKVPSRNLLALPEEVSFELGGLASCAGVTAVHAVRKAGLSVGQTAAVVGAGGIGLMLVQLLSACGVRTAAVDRRRPNVDAALSAGAQLGLLADPGAAEALLRFGDEGEGVDAVFDLVGTASTLRLAAGAVARGGKIIVIGEEQETPPIDTITLAQRELQLIGSRNGGMSDVADALAWLARGLLRPAIAARFSLEQVNEAMDFVRSGEAVGRVVIDVAGG